jgi:DNA polymerase
LSGFIRFGDNTEIRRDRATSIDCEQVKAKSAHINTDARPYLPVRSDASLAQHRRAAERCRGCDLYKNATQVVFGEGKAIAKILFIGEQPGDREDLEGRPFIGPAGKLLDRALAEVRIDRSETYVTNAVKHFKWEPAPRGKRRLHKKPNAREIRACRPWLEREISLIKPHVIVCLGATAGQSLFGGQFRLGTARGKALRDSPWAPWVVCTVHPSSILRAPDHEGRENEYKAFLVDLQLATRAMRSSLRARAKTSSM